MPIVYEVPTHLNVKDTVLFGLGTHQLVRLLAAGSLAYGVWDQATFLPLEFRATVAGLLAATGLLCALVQPAGQPLDRWLIAALLYLLLPRRFAWRRVPVTGHDVMQDASGWADSAPELNWVDPFTDEPGEAPTNRRSW